MKMTIDLKDFSTYLSVGRISNIFKTLNLKEIKFEEEKLLGIQKLNKNNDILEYQHILDYAKTKTEDLYNKRKHEYNHNVNKIIDTQLSSFISDLNINSAIYFNTAWQQKSDILENDLIKEKINKLKKLKSINI